MMMLLRLVLNRRGREGEGRYRLHWMVGRLVLLLIMMLRWSSELVGSGSRQRVLQLRGHLALAERHRCRVQVGVVVRVDERLRRRVCADLWRRLRVCELIGRGRRVARTVVVWAVRVAALLWRA